MRKHRSRKHPEAVGVPVVDTSQVRREAFCVDGMPVCRGVVKLFITCTLFCDIFDIIGARAGLPEVSPGRSPHKPRSHQLSRNQLHSA